MNDALKRSRVGVLVAMLVACSPRTDGVPLPDDTGSRPTARANASEGDTALQGQPPSMTVDVAAAKPAAPEAALPESTPPRVVARAERAIPDPTTVQPMLFAPPPDILDARFSGISPEHELPMTLPADVATAATSLVAAQSWLDIGIRFYSPSAILLPPLAGWMVDVHDAAKGGGLVFDLVTPDGRQAWTLATVPERRLPRDNLRGAHACDGMQGEESKAPLYARLTVHLGAVSYEPATRVVTIAYALGHGCSADGHDLTPMTALVVTGRIPKEAMVAIEAMNAAEAAAPAIARACIEAGKGPPMHLYEQLWQADQRGAVGPVLRAAVVQCELAAAIAEERRRPDEPALQRLLNVAARRPDVVPYEALVLRSTLGSMGIFGPAHVHDLEDPDIRRQRGVG